MRLQDLEELAIANAYQLPRGLEFCGVTADSRNVAKGDVFVALAGSKTDGARYAADAETAGAVAVLCGENAEMGTITIPIVRLRDPRRALALMAARLHAPQPDTVVAVTGTAGKTSVASFTRQVYAHAGMDAASIGTTGVASPSITIEGSLTTPDPVVLHQLLRDLASAGTTHVAMEASSHGLDQRRLDGVKLAAGAFTNLGRDHMDYHPTVDDYLAAKLRLFDTLLGKGQPAVIFADDTFSAAAEAASREAGLDVRTVGRKGAFIALKRVEHERHRQIAEVACGGETYRVELPLAGDFQIANALVSAGLAISTGVEAETAFAALEHLKGAPGRLDLVGQTPNGALVYVDYAHKPDALEQVLLSVRPFTTGKVSVVFGAGGDRDPGKRPIMGEVAARLADRVIVTDDNPRSEDPECIRAAIMKTVPGAAEIGDRREAIREAVCRLERGDTLIIAGKGHETGQTAHGVTRHFSDHEEARAAIEELRP
ncbi:UDP-N-acetylmuramoyl-L-alanyl-D-glutamate--2,6-diaminopimelate ligase [Oricola cellulosilytica]|uniref:UDP-N-acetylmuramoyl-L-alanyl-D-glutamate--2,6-diaminopimelate ligase n=1 Tax=Oricola cellulosilytica TaxID=1429082 RepID=A0A4V2MNY3_9HYPH|nr:UDP-N-acetylmuramoyl-L-alanyl-D-glutamate--2,6-diaminopimelate ligase [Oricola cellulosilytica]TCD15247.1 UDP-N-acetylmuramoyl-L-alanyl-D-glutamate--2,6-diaminopimelate ligase [Oricola cellulosilytica]